MSGRLKKLLPLQGDQRLASDPSAHAALSASAGTGKTHVLTARVLRLLLQGVPPQSILCLTFTKAGAAEMANRLAQRLAAWVRVDDAALGTDLAALDEDVSPDARASARRLFARVIEAPGGLRIQTIHSFAQTLLASFPAEAGVVPGFRPIEGRAESELARRTLAALLAEAEQSRDLSLMADVEALSLRLGEQGAESYLMACARSHEAIAAFAVPGAAEAWLRREIRLPEGSVEGLLAEYCSDEAFDCELLRSIAAANRAWGASSGIAHAEIVDRWLALPAEKRAAALPELASIVLKKDGERRSVSKGLAAAAPEYETHGDRLAEAVSRLIEIQRGAAFADTAAAGLRAGAAFATAYAKAKRAAGVADFDDLIRWTRRLFEQEGIGDWIRFKLDQRTDHVLVDEAQDTNADQWAIVDALVGEFFSGSPEMERRTRTLFMVGDFKQAIFGFQGTDPREFERFRATIAERAAALDLAAAEAELVAREFRDLSINASFRSAPPILQMVDSVIGQVGAERMGLGREPDPHVAARPELPGSVELWPPFVPDAGADEAGEEGWIEEPVRLYADRIAEQVRAMLDEAPHLTSTGRPLAAGDILILVRSRSELASLIVARLFARKVPVAGIDRLHLSKPLVIKDLLSAVGFAVQPNDDLNLAGLLVSPLLGWDQQQLFDVAHARTGSLWEVLQARRDEDDAIKAAHETLSGLLAMADFVTPARYLSIILSGPMRGRRKLFARFGEAARDPIEELVSSALEFERQDTPSLDRFMAWFASGDVEVKRDPSAPSSAVRVMTVHGAKGLEAPLVILADATHDPAKVGGNRSTMDVRLGDHSVPLIRPRAAERVAPFAELIDRQKQRDLEEHWRLFYVGLTRAQERLVIAGVQPGRALSADSWHSQAAEAMATLGASPSPDGRLVWAGTDSAKAAGRQRRSKVDLSAPSRPGWLDSNPAPEERPSRPLAPSAMVEDQEPATPPSPDQRAAARRGTLLHALFERLPAVPPRQRRALALRWLERSGVGDAAEREEIVAAAEAVIDDQRFSDLFAPNALAEAPIAATLADGRVIAGTVDRLCVGADLIKVVDFKTGRSVPADASAVPASHRLQMETYSEALRVIFPGRRVEAALLYTHGPRLIALGG